MPAYFVQVQPSRESHDLSDSQALAGACNGDCRFQEAGWAETAASVEALLLNEVFHRALTLITPAGTKTTLGGIVASVYQCRVRERGAPKKRRGGSGHGLFS